MRLLIVEDELDLATALATGLRREGYAIDTAANAAEARERLEDAPYDVVCLDLGLPDADGREVCRRLRSGELGLPGATPPRVLMLTARDGLDDRVGGLDDGADDYLVKPFSFAELAARVRALARRPTINGGATIRLGSLGLDAARHEAHRNDQRLDLTPKEFALLRYFMLHPSEVLTPERLLEHVWDDRADPFTNTVRVTVSNLRRKLGEAGSGQPIETVVGVGYRLAEGVAVSRSPLRRVAALVRSVRFRLAMMVTAALIVTAGVLVLGMNLALDTVAATIPEQQPTTLEGELLRILDMSLAELEGSGESGATDALLQVEQAVREQTLQTVRNLSLLALLVLVPVGLAIGWAVAGRVVRPVGTIAGVAREIEATDLSRRIRLGGPPDEMRDLADTFDAMLDRLDQGVRTQRRFVEDASHELRNPLAVIRTTLDVALVGARGRRGPAPRRRGGSTDGRPDVDHGGRAHGARPDECPA